MYSLTAPRQKKEKTKNPYQTIAEIYLGFPFKLENVIFYETYQNPTWNAILKIFVCILTVLQLILYKYIMPANMTVKCM